MNFDRVGKSEKISYLLEKVCNLEIALRNEAKDRKVLENCLKDERSKRENLEKVFKEELQKCHRGHQRRQAEMVTLRRWLEEKLGPVCEEEEEDVKYVPPGSLLADDSVGNGQPIVSNLETSTETNEGEVDIIEHEQSVCYMEGEGNQQISAEESAADSDDSSSCEFKISSMSSSFRQMQVEKNEEHETAVTVTSSSSGCSPERKKQRRSEDSESSVVKIKMPFFSCNMCSKKFALRPKLISHMKRRHGVIQKRKRVSKKIPAQNFPCTNCAKEFASRSGLYSHAVVHTPARKKSYRCPVDKCGNKYYTVENFEKHIETRHGNEALSFICLECENRPNFGSDGGLYSEHVQAEHDGKPRRQK